MKDSIFVHKKGYVELVPKKDTVEINFYSSLPSSFAYGKEKEILHSVSDEINLCINVNPIYLTTLLLHLAYVEESPLFNADKTVGLKMYDHKDTDKAIHFYTSPNKPYTLQIKGIDYKERTAGVVFLNFSELSFGAFLTYIKLTLDKYPSLTALLYDNYIVFNRMIDELVILDKDNQKYFIYDEALELFRVSWFNQLTRGFKWTLALDNWQNVIMASDNFIINNVPYPDLMQKQIGYLITAFSIYKPKITK